MLNGKTILNLQNIEKEKIKHVSISITYKFAHIQEHNKKFTMSPKAQIHLSMIRINIYNYNTSKVILAPFC